MSNELGYQLIDFGGGYKLERFGNRIIIRPCPGAVEPRKGSANWNAADLEFDETTDSWRTLRSALENRDDVDVENWKTTIDGLSFSLKPTAAGQVGLFPEHWAHWPWMQQALQSADGLATVRTKVLSLFAYTGATSLWLAKFANCEVTHVDASRPTVAWARENALQSQLQSFPIRWIIDDAMKYVEREVRRGKKYDAIILDPPTFGHGAQKERWEIRRDLPRLMSLCWKLLSEDRRFVLLTGHSSRIDLRGIVRGLKEEFGADGVDQVTFAQNGISDSYGRTLDCGFACKFSFCSAS